MALHELLSWYADAPQGHEAADAAAQLGVQAPLPAENAASTDKPARSETAKQPTKPDRGKSKPAATRSDEKPPAARAAAPAKIVPKGLRSFDANDADFFLELLPGARDRDGLPESIRFWKNRIEQSGPEPPFSVALVYGPSGCGKSSLFKAGLLPRLATHVTPVYLEATADDTELRLLNALRKRCPNLPAGTPGSRSRETSGEHPRTLTSSATLTQTFAALRRGQGLPSGKKVLIVLDQFEQWLHARGNQDNTELVQALRHCDGERVQCIVMVRDDFWMAATRFMRELEIRLVEGQNSAAVDLFERPHALKVLEAFGRALGALPAGSATLSKDQAKFLDQAVSGLAEDGKVICVRLALFAEMMKGKPWTPAALRQVGGMEGVQIS